MFKLWNVSGQSDPTKLKEKAEEVKLLSTDELKQRQMEIKVRPFDSNNWCIQIRIISKKPDSLQL